MANIYTDANFSTDVLGSDVPVLVDFWAPWCGPCKILGPIIEELADEHDGKGVKIGKMNVDENPETPGTHGIMSIPTVVVFKGGIAVDRIVGAQSKEKFAELIAKHV